METKTVRLYFANLAEYNNGRLVGKWYDLEDYTDVDTLMEDVEKEVCYGDFNTNEYAIHDYEAPFSVSEYEGLADIQAMIDFCNLDETDQLKATYLHDNGNYSSLAECIDHVDDVTFYAGMSLSDLAYEFVNEGLFGDVSDNLKNYIDYDAIGRDLGYDGYNETSEGVFECQ